MGSAGAVCTVHSQEIAGVGRWYVGLDTCDDRIQCRRNEKSKRSMGRFPFPTISRLLSARGVPIGSINSPLPSGHYSQSDTPSIASLRSGAMAAVGVCIEWRIGHYADFVRRTSDEG